MEKSCNFAKKIRRVNNEISNRSTQTQQRGSNGLSEQTRQIADKFRARTQEARREFEASNAGSRLTFFQEQDIEKQVAFDIAKENELWIENIYNLGNPFKSGNENTVVLNETEGVVYKSNNLNNTFGRVSALLETVEAHNVLFPEVAYEIVHFTGFENQNRAPYVEVVLRQRFVDNAQHATPQEIKDYMKSLRFTPINSHTFENEDYIVFDLHPRNVLKNENGNIFVIDNRIEIKRR